MPLYTGFKSKYMFQISTIISNTAFYQLYLKAHWRNIVSFYAKSAAYKEPIYFCHNTASLQQNVRNRDWQI